MTLNDPSITCKIKFIVLKKLICLIALSINLMILQPHLSLKQEYNSKNSIHNFTMFPSTWNQTNLHVLSFIVSLKDIEDSVRKNLRLKVNKNQHISNGNILSLKTKSLKTKSSTDAGYISQTENMTKSPKTSKDQTEESASKIKAKLINKVQHSLYGNRKAKNIKNHLKITQLNKGKSNFPSYKELIKNELHDSCADIAILGESNFLRHEPNLNIDYPDFVFENKFHPNANKSRITVMIKKNITYTRLYELETLDSSAIWLKVKLSARKYLYLLCLYRQ